MAYTSISNIYIYIYIYILVECSHVAMGVDLIKALNHESLHNFIWLFFIKLSIPIDTNIVLHV
jgi:hypothetical protein